MRMGSAAGSTHDAGAVYLLLRRRWTGALGGLIFVKSGMIYEIDYGLEYIGGNELKIALVGRWSLEVFARKGIDIYAPRFW